MIITKCALERKWISRRFELIFLQMHTCDLTYFGAK